MFLCVKQAEIMKPWQAMKEQTQVAECGCQRSRLFTAYKWLEAISFRIVYCCQDHEPDEIFDSIIVFGHKDDTVTSYYNMSPDAPFSDDDDGCYWPEHKTRHLDDYEMTQEDAGDLCVFLKELGFVNLQG